jgi:hypothetical protein
VRGVFRAGALGFVNKPNATHDLVAAIEAVQRGRTFFTARFAETVLKSYLEEEKLQGANEPELTERERITIRLLTDEMNMTAAQQWRKPKVTGKAARYAAILLIVLTVSGVGWWVLNGEPEHAPPVLEKLFVSLGLKPSQVSLVNGNPDAKVWIDVHTALYFCAGSESFGKTQKGRLAKQREAQLDHFEPASGKPCD